MTAEEKSALTGQAAEYWLLFLSRSHDMARLTSLEEVIF